MKPVDILKMGPKRELSHVTNDKGFYILTVTPPDFVGLPPQEIELTPNQASRFLQWEINGGLIQDIFPDLDYNQREVILSGISSEVFDGLSEVEFPVNIPED